MSDNNEYIVEETTDGSIAEVEVDAALSGIGTSVIRTFIPSVVGTIAAIAVGFAASKGLNISEATVSAYLIPFTITLFYAGVRWLEVKINPKFGKLLGRASAPVYSK
jgi:ABC-type arginine/histidine transport system permease subunit